MSKIICDICGTSFSDTEERCPICGCPKDFRLEEDLAEELMEEEAPKPAPAKGGRFASKAKPAPVYEEDDEDEEDSDDFDDYDEDDYDEDDDDDDYDDDDDDDDEDDDHKSNAALVILLVVIILALIAVSGFIFVKYLMPSMKPQESAPVATQTTTLPPESTELRIPCENLALTSGGEVVLDMEGANWLINVLALPDNTTDKLEYASSDEAVAVVDAQGKVTAVGEGIAVITITCGEESLQCTVTCDFTPETTVPETTVPETTVPETTVPETTAPQKVTGTITATTLNIRETPSINGKVVGLYGKGYQVTILEQKVAENVKWGRTDKGWISMDYVELDN